MIGKEKTKASRAGTKKELLIDSMSNEDVVNELKVKKLPTFGTAQERKDRLKKHLGMQLRLNNNVGLTAPDPMRDTG